jgi:hypothetical protein
MTDASQQLRENLLGILARAEAKPGFVTFADLPGDLGMAKGQMIKGELDGPQLLRGVGQGLSPLLPALEYLMHFDDGSGGDGGRDEAGDAAVTAIGGVPAGVLALATVDVELGQLREAMEGFAAKAETGDAFEVVEVVNFTGAVGAGGLFEVVVSHATAVVGDADTPLLGVYGDGNAAGSGVEGIFCEFSDDGGQGVDDFSGGDRMNHIIREGRDLSVNWRPVGRGVGRGVGGSQGRGNRH